MKKTNKQKNKKYFFSVGCIHVLEFDDLPISDGGQVPIRPLEKCLERNRKIDKIRMEGPGFDPRAEWDLSVEFACSPCLRKVSPTNINMYNRISSVARTPLKRDC